MPGSNFLAVLRALREGDVEFAVVGGVAASLHGAPAQMFDLDIVPAQDESNLAKLVAVLDAIDAVYRMQPSLRLKPDASHLIAPGPHNLITVCGPLDVLGTIAAHRWNGSRGRIESACAGSGNAYRIEGGTGE